MTDEATLAARRDITAGEELTVDYALFTANPAWGLYGPCKCGSPSCRGTVRGADWRLPEVQDKYRDHFSPFINERIAKIGGQAETWHTHSASLSTRMRGREGLGTAPFGSSRKSSVGAGVLASLRPSLQRAACDLATYLPSHSVALE